MRTRIFAGRSSTNDVVPRRWMLALASMLCVSLGGGLDLGAVTVDLDQPDLARKPSFSVVEGEVQLSLEDAISIALERNLSLVIERYLVQESDLAIKRSKGVYDLFGTIDFQALEDTSPTASNLEAGLGQDVQNFKRDNWNFGVDQLTPTGGTVLLDWVNQRDETNSSFATLNPAYRIDLDLSVRQPLMRNLGKMATERNITIAQTNRNISGANFEQQVTAIILEVERAYWNLAEAIAQLEVAVESEALAVQLHEQNKIRVEVGTLAPLELIQSEAGVANRVVEIIRARAAVGDRADVLRQLLNIERSEDLWSMPIKPTSDPFSEPFEVDVNAAIEAALANRPELKSGYLELSNRELDVRYFRNQQRPRLDLNVTYGLNGVGGDVTEREFITGEITGMEQGDYGDAADQVLNADFDGWRVALNFAYPIQNRTAEANRALAEVSYERGQAELQDLELSIVTEVRRVARLLEASAEAVEGAEVSRHLEEKNYEAEQKRYDNGMSTSFQVLQIQEDLTAARSVYVAAVAAYRRALAQYYQSIGTLIEVSGVEIVGDEADEAAAEAESRS